MIKYKKDEKLNKFENSLNKLINIFINKEVNKNEKNRPVLDDKVNKYNAIRGKNRKSKSQ